MSSLMHWSVLLRGFLSKYKSILQVSPSNLTYSSQHSHGPMVLEVPNSETRQLLAVALLTKGHANWPHFHPYFCFDSELQSSNGVGGTRYVWPRRRSTASVEGYLVGWALGDVRWALGTFRQGPIQDSRGSHSASLSSQLSWQFQLFKSAISTNHLKISGVRLSKLLNRLLHKLFKILSSPKCYRFWHDAPTFSNHGMHKLI